MCKFVNNAKHSRIDKCMVQEINDFNKKLRKKGVKTISSCCGHGKYPKTIVLKDREGYVWEHFSGVTLSAYGENRSYFYAEDSHGCYYIPEIKNLK